ncbi:MAG TPA: hypothetical protein VKA44_05055 [Gemmatimonadota bacterium]|nr:hypothetical protein [Gemmatimonadota bacterium]
MRARKSASATRGTALLGLSALALVWTACSGGEPERGTGETVQPPATPAPASVTPARYVTDMAFVGFGAGAPAAVFRFRHDVAASDLARRYRVWVLRGSAWDTALSLSDTLPVPRAGWRVLPGGGLRIMAGDGGAIGGLVLRAGSSSFGLQPGRVLDEWTSPTGQRSRLALASWAAGPEPASGLLFERREARPYELPPPRTLEESLVVTDGAGNGLLVLRDAGDENPDRSATTAYTWIGGVGARWSEVEARRDSAGAGPPGWRIDVPEAGLAASLRSGAAAADDPAVSDSTTTDAGVRVYVLKGTLRLHGSTRPARGVAIRARGP